MEHCNCDQCVSYPDAPCRESLDVALERARKAEERAAEAVRHLQALIPWTGTALMTEDAIKAVVAAREAAWTFLEKK